MGDWWLHPEIISADECNRRREHQRKIEEREMNVQAVYEYFGYRHVHPSKVVEARP